MRCWLSVCGSYPGEGKSPTAELRSRVQVLWRVVSEVPEGAHCRGEETST